MSQYSIHKFGGSSLANCAGYERVAAILEQNACVGDWVVVSAAGDTTNQLLSLIASQGDEQAVKLTNLIAFQSELLNVLDDVEELRCSLIADQAALEQLLTDKEKHSAEIQAYGELWSSKLLAALLQQRGTQSVALDAREVLTIQEGEIDYFASLHKLQAYKNEAYVTVATGYIAADENKHTQLLGRNGSDYSATLFAKLLNSQQVTIWTDVAGIFSADPRLVAEASPLPALSWSQADKLARLGNPVLHPKTLAPLCRRECRLFIRSSFEADAPGTQIVPDGEASGVSLSLTQNAIAIRVDDLDHELRASAFWFYESEGQDYAVLAADYLEDTGFSGIHVELLALVGREQDFSARAQQLGIQALSNVEQGVLVCRAGITPAQLQALHKLASPKPVLGLVVAGVGNIGQTFLAQLSAQVQRFSQDYEVKLLALLNSRRALVELKGLSEEEALAQFEQGAARYQLSELLEQAKHWPVAHKVLIDITPSEAFSRCYGQVFEAGFDLITANKHANSADIEVFNQYLDAQKQHQRFWLSNTSVGAGLPVNYAIRDLCRSGDRIQAIQGVFSGTLSWLFANYTQDLTFSELLIQAQKQGITEPDPREDLNGNDVARKLTILAREAGIPFDIKDIQVESLVPEALSGIPTQEFLLRADELDTNLKQRLDDASARGQVLRYCAELDVSAGRYTARVGLLSVDTDSPLAALTPGDNLFVITTAWYQSNPLVIRGPGAGREVTAAGLHSDLATLISQISGRPHVCQLERTQCEGVA